MSRKRFVPAVAFVLAVVMAATTSQAVPAAASDPSYVALPELQKEKSVPGSPVPVRPMPPNEIDAAVAQSPAEPRWPAAAAAEIAVSGDADARSAAGNAEYQRVGALPVSVSVDPSTARTRSATSGKVRVETYDQGHAAKAGVAGLMLAVDGTGDAAASSLSVRVDYRDFATAYGGDYGSRLRLTSLPACAATTPDKAECRIATPLTTDNDTHDKTATATVPLPATTATTSGAQAPAVSRTMLAVTAAPSGAGGSFEASGLSPAGQWSAGGSSGDFTYSVALPVPAPTAGVAPKLGLGYSSGTIDGRTSATNNQASAPGDGWELSAGGFIERRYKACADDLGGNQGDRKTGDLCWATDNAVMYLNGVSAELVKVEGTDLWRPKQDDGSRIERLTGAVNGDDLGEHWKITSTNGTQYFLGMNRLPGWSQGNPETASAFTVPVFGNNPGEPCVKPAFGDSWCQQAYRWNLDYVVDPNGNATTYYYDTESNFYGRDQDSGKQTSYVAAGSIRRIEYGLRADALFAPAPSRVWFDSAQRCLPTPTFACNPDQLTKDTAKSWPDVPFDRICKTGAICDNQTSPAFFSRTRLVKVLTQIRRDDVTGAAQWRDVDAWALRHQFPDTDQELSPALWLAGITHTGLAGGSASLPEMLFHGRSMPNRVKVEDGLPAITRYRIERVRNEAGGITEVKYSDRECVTGSAMPVDPETNTMRCFPSWWLPEFGIEARLGWFHKYVVTAITEDDRTGGSALKKTEYQYNGGAAWHFDDAEFTEMKHRTWSQWRGFGEVRTTTGEPGTTQSVSVDKFLRGMDGDRYPKGKDGKRPVVVADSENREVTDVEALAGFTLESQAYDGNTLVSASIKDPWVHGPTATAGEDKAFLTNIAAVRGRTLLGDGSWRRTTLTNTFDDHGNVIKVEDLGDTGVTGDEMCSRTTYLPNTAAGIFTLPSTVRTVGLTCAAGEGTPADLIADIRSSYDENAYDVPPTKGNLTASHRWTGDAYQLTQGTTYDALGRPTEVVNSENHKVLTAYSPGPEFGVRTVTKTNPLGHTAVTTMDPARGLATADVSMTGERADIDYDPLGRVIRTWAPGQSKKDGKPATSEFDYDYNVDGPTVVTTRALRQGGGYTTSYMLYDGLLRERQTQLPAVAGGRLLTDWIYDSRGLQSVVNGAYYNEQEPAKALHGVLDNAVPNQTITKFDTFQRETAVAYHKLGEKQWQTSSSYEADRVTVTPPEGGTTTTTIRDALGRTVEKRQYHGREAIGDYDVTRYAFDVRGQTKSVTVPDGSQWSYEYDSLGRRITDHDPDRGDTRYTYTALDQPASSTDARGATVRAEYDVLGRKSAEYERRAPGQPETKVASWAYDELKKGMLDTSTRWIGDKPYTRQVTGYDDANRPTVSKIVIPEGEGKLTNSYTFRTSYDSSTGRVTSQTQPAAGGLAAEIIGYKYNEQGLPTETEGIDTYVPEHLYSKYGETLRLTMGSGAKTVYTSMFYEEGTRRLDGVDVQRNLESGAYLAKRAYDYDPSGNITRLADSPPGATADVQCFAYDYLKRMTSAFTPRNGNCAQQPSVAAMGGAAPYWHEYSFDKAGNRTQDTDHRADGDVTRTYAYGGNNGTQPHLLRSVTQTGPQGTSRDEYAYDATGNTTTRNVAGSPQKLEWDPAGRSEKVTEHDGRTSNYVYDADGSRLIKRESGITTLYLDGMELVLQNTTKELTGRRYYSHGGDTVAVRTSGPKGNLSWLLGDHQGTASMTVNAATLEVSTRRQDPFGNPRGEQPTSWSDDKGFVGGTKDESGLTNLGERQYDSTTGRFISVDPVLDTDDPQQMNGYAYANNSPVTNSDPSGLYWKTMAVAKFVAKFVVLWAIYYIGLNTAILFPIVFMYWSVQIFTYRVWIDPPSSGGGNAQAVKNAGLSQDEYEDAKKAAADKRSWIDVAIQVGGDILQEIVGIKGIVDNCIKSFSLLKCGFEVLTALPWGKILKGGKIVDKIVDAFKDTLSWIRKRDKAQGDLHRVREAEERLAAAGGCNSFMPGTLVVMGDGTRKPIEEVKIGDTVLAANAETGVAGPRAVVATIVGQGVKHLVQVSAVRQGWEPGKPDSVVATAGHPFWSPIAKTWIPASEVLPGTVLQSSDGSWKNVVAARSWTAIERVYNLTIDIEHTYYVGSPEGDLLTHNASKCEPLETQVKGKTPPLTTSQAKDLAAYNGYVPTKRILKGEKIFTNGKTFIVQDTTSHIGGIWKIAKSPDALASKSSRTATTDALLTPIGG